MIVYISGPMILHEDLNLSAFDEAQKLLESFGHTVLSPAVWSRADKEESVLPEERLKQYPTYLRRDYRYLLDADAIVMLPGWQKSTGATDEFRLAFFLNIPIYSLHGILEDHTPLIWEGDQTREIMEMTNAAFLSCLAIVSQARETGNHPKSTWRGETSLHHRYCAVGHLNTANRQIDPGDKHYNSPEPHGAEGCCRANMAMANEIMRGEIPNAIRDILR